MGLTELIARAPWREAVTYRDTWPHEYVLLQKDDQRELLRPSASACATAKVFRVDFSRCAMRTCSSAITSTG